jgi:tetratricopeptide repeat protein
MDQRYRSLAGLIGGATLLLGGCFSPLPRPAPAPPPAAPPYSAPGPVPAPPVPPPQRPPPPPAHEYHLSPASQSLVTQARSLLAHGDLDGASATLDRAIRIEPNNPLLWIELGRVQVVAGEARAAEGCARKALTLANGDRAAQAQAGHVLVDALRAQGRNQEAQEISSRPYMR